MKTIKKEFYFQIAITLIALSLFIPSLTFAQEEPVPLPEDPASVENPPPVDVEVQNNFVNIQISDGENKLDFPNTALSEEESINILDSSGESHSVSVKSVLSALYLLDQKEDNFSITDLIYYPSFSALYLRCILFQGEEKCDNWVYEVNGESPSVGMDNFILKDGDTVRVYFSSFLGDSGGAIDEEPTPPPQQKKRSSTGGRWIEPIVQEEPLNEEVKTEESTGAILEIKPVDPVPIKIITKKEERKVASIEAIKITAPPAEAPLTSKVENNLLANAGENAPIRLPYITIAVALIAGIIGLRLFYKQN